jgi:hypothetical protein
MIIVGEKLRFWGEYQAIFIPLSAAPGVSIDVELLNHSVCRE